MGESPAQDLTSLESAIRTGTIEQKRDALFQIRNLRSDTASRLALPALRDSEPIVRATAAASVVFLPPPEAVASLSPLLADKEAFVRKETAYALGRTGSSAAAPPLLDLLRREKDLEVRAAAAHAVGQTGDISAIELLVTLLKRSPKDDEEFIRRAAARSIGQIAQIAANGNGRVVTPQSYLPEKFKDLGTGETGHMPGAFDAAVSTLSTLLKDEREADDTRREAAFALGAIGNPSAVNVLRAFSGAADPVLAEIVREALAKIANREPVN